MAFLDRASPRLAMAAAFLALTAGCAPGGVVSAPVTDTRLDPVFPQGCTDGRPPIYRNGAGLTALRDSELRRVLVGREMRSCDPRRISDAPTGRGFASDGHYYDIGPRGGRGVWRIESDRVCVAPIRNPSGWTCYQVFGDGRGLFYMYSDLLILGGVPPYYEVYFEAP